MEKYFATVKNFCNNLKSAKCVKRSLNKNFYRMICCNKHVSYLSLLLISVFHWCIMRIVFAGVHEWRLQKFFNLLDPVISHIVFYMMWQGAETLHVIDEWSHLHKKSDISNGWRKNIFLWHVYTWEWMNDKIKML